MRRLADLDGLPADVRLPRYDRAALRPGILHLGLGAFHRAHQAPATDAAIEAAGGDWGIEGVSLRSAEAARRLRPQDGLYSMLVRGPEGTRAQVVGAVLKAHVLPETPERVRARLADPAIRIVSLTVTEKAYGLDAATGGLDLAHPAIAADFITPEAPTGAIGLIVHGLRARRAVGLPPFTPLSCDNLPGNGSVLRRLTLEMAGRVDEGLARWIEREVPFPSTMVDRITPASTETTFADAARLLGREDLAAVETEPFWQWVIEDRFAPGRPTSGRPTSGRPAWDAAGALLVDDVGAYETMKLRMLNGAHSLLAYVGFLDGRTFVRDVMAEPVLARMVRLHMQAAARTLEAVPGIDLDAYADELCARFANPAIAHRTAQIAMDGTQKLPQRLLEPAILALRAGESGASYALAVAAWMRFVMGRRDNGERYAVDDPRSAEIQAALAGQPADAVASRLLALAGLFPVELALNKAWRARVEASLALLLHKGAHAAAEALVAS